MCSFGIHLCKPVSHSCSWWVHLCCLPSSQQLESLLPASTAGDVHEEIADKLLEYVDQLQQTRHRSLLPQPSVQRRSKLPMSIQPQQQVPESSSYIELNQHADSLPSTSGDHLPQRLQFQAAQQLLTQATWSGEQLESQTGQLPHLAQQLQASIRQQPPQQLPSLAQHLPQQPEQLLGSTAATASSTAATASSTAAIASSTAATASSTAAGNHRALAQTPENGAGSPACST